MKNLTRALWSTALLGASLTAIAQINTPIYGRPVAGLLGAPQMIIDDGGYAGNQSGKTLNLHGDHVYQIQVRSYYYTPIVELWDNTQPLAYSRPLTPYHDGRGQVYIAEIAYRPERQGTYYMRVNADHQYPRSTEFAVQVFHYKVADERPPAPPPLPNPSPPAPQPQPSGPCRCPPGFEHYYGTVCVGINTPETAECVSG